MKAGVLILFLLLLVVVSLTGCEAVKGVGRDVQNIGGWGDN